MAQHQAGTQSAVDFRTIKKDKKGTMKAQMLPNDWHILSARCRPVALLVLILFPLVWLGTMPIRLNVTTLQSVFGLLTQL